MRQRLRPWRWFSFKNSVALAFLIVWVSANALRPNPSLPVDALLQADGWADERACAECHHQAESFPLTGHAQALRPATDELSRSRLRELAATPAAREAGIRVETEGDEIRVFHEDGDVVRELRLDWCFGSGNLAHTWVGTMTDSWGATDLIEFRWSWYSLICGFDIAPGHAKEQPSGHFGALGELYDPPKTYRCFACHTSQLAFEFKDGRLDPSAIHPGITCQRCHGHRERHVESGGEVVDPFWREASRMEQVHRCAQCHRRAEERPPEEIRPDNVDIARFQPVGLVQSTCFQKSEMTCTTCHDPHRPLSAQNSSGIWQCVQCHDGGKKTHVTCAAGHKQGCLSCHMPKVRPDNPRRLTDHWIRVRDSGGPEP